MCIPEGKLRTRLDGELTEREAAEVDSHLAECARCREKAKALEARAAIVTAMLNGLGPAEEPAAPGFALARIRARADEAARTRRPAWTRLFQKRWAPVWTAAAALAVAFGFYTGPTVAMAQKLLGLFRAKNVVAVPVDFRLAREGDGKILERLLAENVTVDKNEPPRTVATRAEAEELAGFTVRLPAAIEEPPQLTVTGEQASHFVADMKRLRAMMDVVNRPDLEIPPGLEGAQIAVNVPRGVRAVYGDCEKRQDARECVTVIQTPTPTVATIPDLNLREIAEVGLQAAGMTPEEARRFSDAVEWSSTLAVPIPIDSAESGNVTVDGVKGVLITTRARVERPAAAIVIWIKNGVVYTVAAMGAPSRAVSIAGSMS